MPEMRLRPELRPGPRWGSLQRSPYPLAGFKGAYFSGKGRRRERERGGKGRKGKWRGGEREGEDRGGKRREGKGRGRFDPHFSLPSATPAYNNKP